MSSAPDDSELGAVGPAVDPVAQPLGYGITSSGQLYKMYRGSAETQRRLARECKSVFQRLGPSPASGTAGAPSVDPLPAQAGFRIPRTSSRDRRRDTSATTSDVSPRLRPQLTAVVPAPPSAAGATATAVATLVAMVSADATAGNERPPVHRESGNQPRQRSPVTSVAAPVQGSGRVSRAEPPLPPPLPTLAPHVFFDGVRWVSWCPVRHRVWVRRGDRWLSPEPADRP